MSDIQTQEKSGGRLFYFLLTLFLIFLAYRIGVKQGEYSFTGNSSSLFSFPLFYQNNPSQEDVDLSLFWKSWDLLKSRYVNTKDLQDTAMVEGAIRGMMATTEDPYTTFLNSEENANLESDISGSFEGIGAEIGIRDKVLTVIAPLSGSPAEKSGLRSGDSILKINDEETLQMSLIEAVKKMRGSKGTEVTFTIFRDGEEGTRQITVVRDHIDVKSVTVSYKESGIAYIELIRFGEDTTKDFQAISKEILTRGSKGIVLDMRNNPGGLLQTAIDLGGSFLERGSVVVQEEYGNEKKVIEKTTGKGELKNIPVVVLINEGSASASEILAGALKDNRKDVTLVGEKTFGKGSVQELIPLSGGTAAKITVAKWYTPSGKGIDKEGINPDVEVVLTDEDFNQDKDPQLEKSLEILIQNR